MNKVYEGELARKAIHYISSLIPLLYYLFFPKETGLIVIGLMTLGILLAEVLRMTIPSCKRFYVQIFGWMVRPHEKENHLTGASYVFLGSLIVIYFFPKEIATISLLFLTIGDPSAALIGMAFGKIRLLHKKTLEGALAFVLSGLLVTFWIPGVPFWVKVVGAVATCFVELMSWKLDDNITIPLIGSILMVALMR
ncbi:MAG: diacylglycerol/polyprenol kinase family protein [Candidatus Neomarinimicrobiota bacterium]